MRLLEADFVAAGADPPVGITIIKKGAGAIEGDQIVDIGLATDLAARHTSAEREQFPDAILMPGFVNAHQHGRGLSQIQLGYPDDQLEPWIARRSRGAGCIRRNPARRRGDAGKRRYRDIARQLQLCLR